jgi:molecular chaperone GrpE
MNEAEANSGPGRESAETARNPAEAPIQDAEAKAAEAGQPQAPEADPQTIISELKDRLLRALAEVENVRRRGEREREDARLYAATGFARDMVRVADNLRRALESVPAEAKGENAALMTLLEGVELTERDLLSIFERNGIKRVDPLGQKFDHNLHEALFEVPGTGQPGGTVLQVIEPGYTIHDRLLRPARVGVAQAEAGPARVDTSA